MLSFAHRLPTRMLRRIIRPYRAIEGFLSENEAVECFRMANRIQSPATIVEIGSWKGKSTFCLARGLRSGGMLHAIDPFNATGEPGSAEIYARESQGEMLRMHFESNIEREASRITIHQGLSREFAGLFHGIDLLFIDGDHSIKGAQFDYEHFSPAIIPGGCIMFHDYYPDRTDLGPSWVIDNLVRSSGQYRDFRQVDSLWIARKV